LNQGGFASISAKATESAFRRMLQGRAPRTKVEQDLPLGALMNKRVDILAGQAALLPADEQIALVERILAKVHPTKPEVDGAWVAEANDRVAAYERGEVETFDADEAIAELRGKAKGKR
jgi:Putative addiction module component